MPRADAQECVFHSTPLGVVSDSTLPREGTGWYKPKGVYCGMLTL